MKKSEQFTGETKQIDKSKPPEIVDVLAAFIERMSNSKKPLPAGMPSNKYEAARWWIDLIEKPTRRDIPDPITKDGRTIGWKTPYHDRLVYLLRVFYSMTRPQQTWIIETIKAGICWRGDTQEQFSRIITVNNHIADDREAYIGRCKKVLDKMRNQ